MSSPFVSNTSGKKSIVTEEHPIQQNTLQNFTNFTQNTEIISNLKNFFSINSKDLSKSNEYLCSLINWQNSQNFISALLNPLDFHIKLFSSNALLYLFTNNYTEIEIEKAQFIFDSILNYLFQHREILYDENIRNNNGETSNEKLYMKSLIKLISRIIRVFYPQCNYFKKFMTEMINKSSIYKNDSNILKILIEIFTEVIYQFQTNFGLNKNTIQMNKYFGTLEEFKEASLIGIFNYTCDVVQNIINHKIQTDNLKDMLQLSKQVVLCLLECLDYSEDINIKEENYNKYEIKPTYIPSPRRRGKDKKLNIIFLLGLCQNLFDLYNMIIKAFISLNNNNINNNENSDEYFYVSEGILKILAKLVCMKIQYLDINKGRILKNFTSNLGNMLYNQYGFIHHEYFCQIIYRLKKNYNFIDLTNGYETFWSLILPFIENSINLITNHGDKNSILSLEVLKNHNIINNSSEVFLPGTLYLIRFLGYFSHNLYKISLNYQIKLKQFILSIFKILLESNFGNFDWGIHVGEICKSVGVLGEGVYIQILEDLVGYINNDFNNGEIINLCVKIKIGIEVLKNNYRHIEEQRLTNKLSDNDLDSFSDIDLSDDKPEINAIVNFIKCVFNIIKNIMNFMQKNNFENKCFNHFGLLSNTILKFIKFFCRHFLSKYLNNLLTYTINSLINDIESNNSNNNNNLEKEEKTPEDLIVFIINVLICFNSKIESNDKNQNMINNNITAEEKLLNNKIVPKILKIISDNFTFETDYSNKIYPSKNINKSFTNNISSDNQSTSRLIDDNINKINSLKDNNENNNNSSSPSKSNNTSSLSKIKNSFSHNSSLISTPQIKSNNLLNNETIENISKISFSQRLPSKNRTQNNNRHNIKTVIDEDDIINEEISINSVDIHLGKIRLDKDKFINILKQLFNKVISLNSEVLPFKIKKHFIVFLFKIIFQCYLPFETAINYFITQLSKIQSNDIKDFIYIMNAMISSVSTQENYQILINIILPSIQTLCNSSIIKNPNMNNLDKDNLISLKKALKLIKDITNFEECNIKNFANNSQCPIQLFSITGNLMDYYISIAQNINLKNLTDEQIYLVQIKPISYIIQIYYNLFSHYIQVPLFINTNYTYMKNLFYKLSKIIFSVDVQNLFGYSNKYKQFMKLIKIIYCDYIMLDSILITDFNNDYNNFNNFICDITYIPHIVKLFTRVINEDIMDNIVNKDYSFSQDNLYEKINFSSFTKSNENIRECFKDFNNIIYDWCKLYIQNKNIIGIQFNNNNSSNQNNNNNLGKNSLNNNAQILLSIFTNENINSFLYEILLPLLQGLVLNIYSTTELNDSLSKTIFILAYAFPEQYINIFENMMNSNKIKQFYSDEEIKAIKYNFELLNNMQKIGGSNIGTNNLNEIVDSYYELFREQLKEFAKKIQNIIVSRKKDINTIDINDENILVD